MAWGGLGALGEGVRGVVLHETRMLPVMRLLK